MRAIFLDSNMCYITLSQLTIRVQLREAALNDAPFLILEALSATHRSHTTELLVALHPVEGMCVYLVTQEIRKKCCQVMSY